MVLYARVVTTGDPSAQQTSPSRASTEVTPKKPGSAAAKEPRSGAAKAGTVKKRAPRSVTPKREADVLERLNKLAEPEPDDQALTPMPIALPAIIEADPSLPLPAPSAEQLSRAAVIDVPARSPSAPSGDDTGNGSTHVVRPVTVDDSAATVRPGASAPASVRSSSAVDVDVPTELVDFSPPTIVVPDLFPGPVQPERTQAVPLAGFAPAPTVAMPATLTGADVDESTGMLLPQRPLQRPVAFQRGKPRVRRVTRVVRHVDTFSVFKVALVFNTILFIVCLTSGVLLWNVANATGTVDNVEKFFEQFGWSTFEFNGGELYHNAWSAGLFGALFLTGMAVFVATVFNLITDLVGGIRVSVLEEEVMARSTATTPSMRSRLRQVRRSEQFQTDVDPTNSVEM
jgi:Transmembrane domain of unknown function (DUF3566)